MFLVDSVPVVPLYLHRMEWPKVGLEPLAIIFSLPYALLMWSYVVFVIPSQTLCIVLILKQRLGVLRFPVDI